MNRKMNRKKSGSWGLSPWCGARAVVGAVLVAAPFVAAGCGGRAATEDPSSDLGVVTLNLTAATGVESVQFTFANVTRSVTRCVPVDGTPTSRLDALPTGMVKVTGGGFANATCTGDPIWVAEPALVTLVPGIASDVHLEYRPNGIVTVGTTFIDDCVVGDIALNPNGSGFPSPLESDAGWGGGAQPFEILDGHTSYLDTWAHGLAFTGGNGSYSGEACGPRQATVDFGAPKTFNRVLAWHHGMEHVPNSYHVEVFDGTSWVNAGGTSSLRADLADYPAAGWGSIPTESVFPAVTASKVRFVIDTNCDITHGWLYSLQTFSACGTN
jgi:hypothetical protein